MRENKMPGPIELERIQKENLTEEQIVQDKEREVQHDLKIEKDLLEVIESGDEHLILGVADSTILPTKVIEKLLELDNPKVDARLARNDHLQITHDDLLFGKYINKNMDRENDYLLFSLVSKRQLSITNQLIIARLRQTKNSPHDNYEIRQIQMYFANNPYLSTEVAKKLVEIRDGDVKTNLSKNEAVSLDIIHSAVEGFGLGMQYQTPFEGALHRKSGVLDKTLISIIKQVSDEMEQFEKSEDGRALARLNYKGWTSKSLMIGENTGYLARASWMLKSRIEEIIETNPVEKLQEILDVSKEDYEKYVKPLAEEVLKK